MFNRRRTIDDFAREIAAHVAIETERLIDAGIDPETARWAARRTFGNATSVMERFYESRRRLWLDHLLHDLRSSVRSMTKYPVACLVAIVSLAGGIGATTATLVVRDVVFRRPPPLYREPDQLSRVQVGSPDRPIRGMGSPVPGTLAAAWRQARLGAAPAAGTAVGVREVRTADRTVQVPIWSVTPEFFSVLGVSAASGRTFSYAGDGAGPTPAVLSSHVLRTLFDGRHDVLGEALWIENRPHVVIGVMPDGFWFSRMISPIWTPFSATGLASAPGVEVLVRREPGMTAEMLAARLQPGLSAYARQLPAAERDLRVKVSGIEGTPLGHAVSRALPWLLGAAVLLTLLIACANVSESRLGSEAVRAA